MIKPVKSRSGWFGAAAPRSPLRRHSRSKSKFYADVITWRTPPSRSAAEEHRHQHLSKARKSLRRRPSPFRSAPAFSANARVARATGHAAEECETAKHSQSLFVAQIWLQDIESAGRIPGVQSTERPHCGKIIELRRGVFTETRFEPEQRDLRPEPLGTGVWTSRIVRGRPRTKKTSALMVPVSDAFHFSTRTVSRRRSQLWAATMGPLAPSIATAKQPASRRAV